MSGLQTILHAVIPRWTAQIFPVTLRILALGGIVTCTYWSIRLSIADLWAHSEDLERTRAAVSLAPGNSNYLLRLGEEARLTGGSAIGAFQKAVEASPHDSSVWTALGFASEASGDVAGAERAFLEAAKLDHQFDPKWTLAGFYLRRQNQPQFWHWTRSALSMGRGDLSPLFAASWEMTDDAKTVRDMLPRRPLVLTQYFDWLVYSGKYKAAETSAADALRFAGQREKIPLLILCNQLWNEHRPEQASAIWSRMQQRKLVGDGSGDSSGNLLFNARFLQPPLNSGFDWRMLPMDGVDMLTGAGLRVEFSGTQPENCTLLEQPVTVIPGKKLHFQCRYQASGIASATGVHWHFVDAGAEGQSIATSPDLSSSDDGTAETDVAIPPKTHQLMLRLDYQRTPGTVRVEGELTVESLLLRYEE